MLKIKQKIAFELPELPTLPKQMQFEPVSNEDDELIQSIDGQLDQHDDNWQLTETPDSAELEDYWSKVETDIAHDPEWVWVDQD